jgi:hypothetical protein
MKHHLPRATLALVGAGILSIYGCGGGSGSGGSGSGSLTISGTAATGAAIANGAVSVKCVSGTGTATTNADGSYTITISGGTAPCMLKASATDAKGVITDLYSAVEAGQTTANITPLTQMVVAAALGTDPATVFTAGVSASTATNLSTAALSTAVTTVQQVATNLGLTLSIDPLKATLVAATDNATGNAQDQLIDGLMVALKNSNITVAQLTTAVVNNASSATAAVSAITASADVNAPLTASSLSSCPVARSGGYLYASPGDTALNRVFINFGSTSITPPSGWTGAGTVPTNLASLTGYDYTNGASFTVAPVTVSSVTVPCAYTFTVGSKPVNVRVSAAGLAAFSINGATTSSFPNSTAVAFDGGASSAAGLILPIQKKWTKADLAGTMYAMNFGKVTTATSAFGTNSAGVYKNFYTKFVVAAGGATAKSWICTAPGSCPPETDPTTNDYTVSGPDPLDGTFTFTAVTAGGVTVAGNPSQVVVYSAPNGDTVAMGVVSTTNLVGLSSNFFFMSNRVSTTPRRAVGDVYGGWSWQVTNNSAGTLSQLSNENVFTVTGISSNAFDRSWTSSGVNYTDTLTLDSPIKGMVTRGAGTASTGNAPKPFYAFTGAGWSVFASAAPGGGTDQPSVLKPNNFLGFSIAKQ